MQKNNEQNIEMGNRCVYHKQTMLQSLPMYIFNSRMNMLPVRRFNWLIKLILHSIFTQLTKIKRP